MRTIDPGNVHAGINQLLHHVEISRSFGGQGHHDADRASGGGMAEQPERVFFKQFTAAAAACGLLCRFVLPGLPREAVQQAQYLVEVGQHMGLRASQRRQSEPRQLVLQRAQVDAAQGEVMNQVAGALAVLGQDFVEFSLERCFALEHRLPQGPELVDELDTNIKVLRVAPCCGRYGNGSVVLFTHGAFIGAFHDIVMKNNINVATTSARAATGSTLRIHPGHKPG